MNTTEARVCSSGWNWWRTETPKKQRVLKHNTLSSGLFCCCCCWLCFFLSFTITKKRAKILVACVDRLRQEHILFSTDGPHRNVLKFKPPMCFNTENADELLTKMDKILAEIEAGTYGLDTSILGFGTFRFEGFHHWELCWRFVFSQWSWGGAGDSETDEWRS